MFKIILRAYMLTQIYMYGVNSVKMGSVIVIVRADHRHTDRHFLKSTFWVQGTQEILLTKTQNRFLPTKLGYMLFSLSLLYYILF